MLVDDVGGEPAERSAQVKSVGEVVCLFRCTGTGGPAGSRRVAPARAVHELIHRAEMRRTIGEAVFRGVVPPGVFGVAAAGHRAIVPDVRKGIGAAGRVVGEHCIGAQRALTPERERAKTGGRYAAIEFVIERLARARTVAGLRVAAPGETVVDGVGG